MDKQSGFSYAVVIFLVAVVSLVSVRALEHAHTAERRDKELALLETGQAYRNAIEDYYDHSPGTAKAYPPNLEALLLDVRATRVRRPLRKLYRDPMSGQQTWGLVHTADGAIKGVYSLSPLKPVKRAGFPAPLKAFATANSYQDWLFVFDPEPLQTSQPPATVENQ